MCCFHVTMSRSRLTYIVFPLIIITGSRIRLIQLKDRFKYPVTPLVDS